MKTRFLFISLLLPLMVFCTKPGQNNNEGTTDTPSGSTTEEENRIIKDGATVCVVNPEVQRYLEEVTYPEGVYTVSYLKNYEASPGSSDIPPVFTIKWTKDASAGALKASLSEPTWSREWDLKAGVDSLDITNLRPNATYQYSIASASDPSKVLTSGSFNTTGLVHQIFFRLMVRNARDLGGWKTKDGKTVKYRKIYRGGRLEEIGTKGVPELQAEGIKAELDLRGWSYKKDENGKYVLDENGQKIKTTHDFLSESPKGMGLTFLAPEIDEGYRDMLEDDKEKTRQCVQFVINCMRNNEPVYFHCSLGRDRTGTMAMILLGLAGVDEGDISKDYELTQFSPKGWGVCEGEPFDNSKTEAKYHNEADRMSRTQQWGYQHAAKYIWAQGASGDSFQTCMEKYLISIGISATDIAWYKENIVE